jgi:hypothetical protein
MEPKMTSDLMNGFIVNLIKKSMSISTSIPMIFSSIILIRKRTLQRLLFCCSFILIFAQPAANALENIPSIDDLINNGELRIQVSIEQQSDPIVQQAFIISIELSTNRWFAQGTRTQPFQLSNTVMLADNVITINGTKRIDGITWSTQLHDITLYPLQAGKYTLPSIAVDVSVNTEKYGVISGVVNTQAKEFVIKLPETLVGVENYIVSSNVTLEIEGGFSEDESIDNTNKEKSYAIGEAVTQILTITAHDIPAMMLPTLTTTFINKGVSIYNKPSKLFDQSNRGTVVGKRVESTSYIFEESGKYTLPAQTLYWWNTVDNALEEIVIPASTWTVSNGTDHKNTKRLTDSLSLISTTQYIMNMLIVLTILSIVTFIIWLTHKYKRVLIHFYLNVTHYEQRQLKHLFLQALAKKEYQQAAQYLYSYSLLLSRQKIMLDNPNDLALAERLNQLAYAKPVQISEKMTFTLKEGRYLLKALNCNAVKKSKNSNLLICANIKQGDGQPSDIQLNEQGN